MLVFYIDPAKSSASPASFHLVSLFFADVVPFSSIWEEKNPFRSPSNRFFLEATPTQREKRELKFDFFFVHIVEFVVKQNTTIAIWRGRHRKSDRVLPVFLTRKKTTVTAMKGTTKKGL